MTKTNKNTISFITVILLIISFVLGVCYFNTNSKYNNSQTELNTLQSQLNTANTSITNLTNQKQTLEASVTNLTNQNQSLETQVTNLTNENGQLQNQLINIGNNKGVDCLLNQRFAELKDNYTNTLISSNIHLFDYDKFNCYFEEGNTNNNFNSIDAYFDSLLNSGHSINLTVYDRLILKLDGRITTFDFSGDTESFDSDKIQIFVDGVEMIEKFNYPVSSDENKIKFYVTYSIDEDVLKINFDRCSFKIINPFNEEVELLSGFDFSSHFFDCEFLIQPEESSFESIQINLHSSNYYFRIVVNCENGLVYVDPNDSMEYIPTQNTYFNFENGLPVLTIGEEDYEYFELLFNNQ